jgi:hypothetical protein
MYVYTYSGHTVLSTVELNPHVEVSCLGECAFLIFRRPEGQWYLQVVQVAASCTRA